jgi:phosphatidate cytidylyltransferase
MEKGAKLKEIFKLSELFKQLIKLLFWLYNYLISQIHFLDPKNNTTQRVAAAIVLMPIAILAILFSTDLFDFLALLIAILMTAEWLEMTKNQPNKKRWQLFGLLYILIPLFCAMKIRHYDGQILLWMFAIIWTTDIFAFFVGRKLGGPKLIPKVSPNKTWSGLIGGVFASALIGLISKLMFANGSVLFFMTASTLLSILEQISDLCESKIKRICRVKDSGSIIPGHGGIIDRLDGMILLAPAIWILVMLFPSQFSQ